MTNEKTPPHDLQETDTSQPWTPPWLEPDPLPQAKGEPLEALPPPGSVRPPQQVMSFGEAKRIIEEECCKLGLNAYRRPQDPPLLSTVRAEGPFTIHLANHSNVFYPEMCETGLRAHFRVVVAPLLREP